MNIKNKIIKVADVFQTTDYDMFGILKENRAILPKRVNKLIKSIRENGYIRNPIVVNENHDTIDGQARLEALKMLGLPVEFIICPGAGRDECVALNAYSTPWTMLDYIDSYADVCADYKRARLLIDEFKELKLSVVLSAISGLIYKNNEAIKGGKLSCTAEQYERAHALLEYASRFSEVLSNINGNKDRIYNSIMFCYGHEDVDNNTLLKKLNEHINLLNNTTDMEQVNKCMENIYNFNSRKPRVYIESDYRRYQEGRYPWYAKKYGRKRDQRTKED